MEQKRIYREKEEREGDFLSDNSKKLRKILKHTNKS